jgi:tRNA-2-methylthio-N6-dimethylallyladenosine synthase
MTLASSEATADVILLNTCSVRDAAEQRALNKMTTLSRQLRRKRPEVVLGFLGCMAQSRGQALIDQLPDVDLGVGDAEVSSGGRVFGRAAGGSAGAGGGRGY